MADSMLAIQMKQERDRLLVESRQHISDRSGDRFNELLDQARELSRRLKGGSDPEYRSAFSRMLTPEVSGEGLTEDERRALYIGSDSAGGYLVPTELERAIVAKRDETAGLRRFCTVTPVRRSGGVPLTDSVTAAEWVPENSAFSQSDPGFAVARVPAWKLGRIIKLSHELVQDGADAVMAELGRIGGRALALGEDAGILTGSGAARPVGLTLSATNAVTAGAADAITGDELTTLVHAVPTPYHPNARFIMARGTLEVIAKLKAGAGEYLGLVQFRNGEPFLMGFPVSVSAAMPAMAASAVPILFGDLSFVRIVERGGIYIQTLRELYATLGQVGYLIYERMGAALLVSEAMTKVTMAAA